MWSWLSPTCCCCRRRRFRDIFIIKKLFKTSKPHKVISRQSFKEQKETDRQSEWETERGEKEHLKMSHMSRKLIKFLILFDNSNLLFFPGQFLSGRIIVEVDDDMPVLGKFLFNLNFSVNPMKRPGVYPWLWIISNNHNRVFFTKAKCEKLCH